MTDEFEVFSPCSATRPSELSSGITGNEQTPGQPTSSFQHQDVADSAPVDSQEENQQIAERVVGRKSRKRTKHNTSELHKKNEAEKKRIKQLADIISLLREELALHNRTGSGVCGNPHSVSRNDLLRMTLQQLIKHRGSGCAVPSLHVPSESQHDLTWSPGLASGQPRPSVPEAARPLSKLPSDSHHDSATKRKKCNGTSSGANMSPANEQQHSFSAQPADDTVDMETLHLPIDLDMFEMRFPETEHNSSTRTGSGSGVGTVNAGRIANYEPAVAEVAIDVEIHHSPFDLEMFEVQILETESNSSNRTGSGSGVGNHPISPIANCEPTMAACTNTVNISDLSCDAHAEEKKALGTVAGLISHCSDWYGVGTASFHLPMIMLAVLARILVGDWETAPRMFTWSDKDEARGVGVGLLSRLRNLLGVGLITTEIRDDEFLPENTDHLHLLLALCCLLGAAWCCCLPVWATDWLGRLESERNISKAVRRTWIRCYLCIPLPLILISCAFQSYQDSGSVQTTTGQLLLRLVSTGFISLTVPLTLLQAGENALGIRRAALLAYGILTVGTGARTATLEDVMIVRWHLCSAMIYTSLIAHLQDSLFILAVALAARPTGFSKAVGITLMSTVVLCGKLVWCRLGNRRSMTEGVSPSSIHLMLEPSRSSKK